MRGIISVIALLSLSGAAQATEDHALDTLYGVCMATNMTNRIIDELASSMQWRTMDEGLLAPMRPQAPQKYLKGWLAHDGSSPPYYFLLMIAEPLATKDTETCGLFLPNLKPAMFVARLVAETDAVKLDEIELLGERNVIFSIPGFSGSISVTFSLRAGANDVMIFVLRSRTTS